MTRKTLLKRTAGFSLIGILALAVLVLAYKLEDLKGALAVMGYLAGIMGLIWMLEWLLCSKD